MKFLIEESQKVFKNSEIMKKNKKKTNSFVDIGEITRQAGLQDQDLGAGNIQRNEPGVGDSFSLREAV